jgi:PhnB protein
MAMPVKPIGTSVRSTDGFTTATPYLLVKNASEAIDFYKKAFGATQLMTPLTDPNSGKIVHAEIKIGDSPIMLSDEFNEFGVKSPASLGGTSVHIHLYVDDADSVAQQAIAAGAQELVPVADQFYGDRAGRIVDPYGHVWIIATHKEILSHQERQDRTKNFLLDPKTKDFILDPDKNPLLGAHPVAEKAFEVGKDLH